MHLSMSWIFFSWRVTHNFISDDHPPWVRPWQFPVEFNHWWLMYWDKPWMNSCTPGIKIFPIFWRNTQFPPGNLDQSLLVTPLFLSYIFGLRSSETQSVKEEIWTSSSMEFLCGFLQEHYPFLVTKLLDNKAYGHWNRKKHFFYCIIWGDSDWIYSIAHELILAPKDIRQWFKTYPNFLKILF